MVCHTLTIPIKHHPLASILRSITLWFDSKGVARLQFNRQTSSTPEFSLPDNPPPYLELTIGQIRDYIAGKTVHFHSVPLSLPKAATQMQQTVWNAARKVPYGYTITYGELAQRIAGPSYARAVGSALRANPLPIIVPCHRIVAANGSPGGFSCGIDLKHALLALEGKPR